MSLFYWVWCFWLDIESGSTMLLCMAMRGIYLDDLIGAVSGLQLEGDGSVVIDRADYHLSANPERCLFADIEEFVEYNQWGRSREALGVVGRDPAAILTHDPAFASDLPILRCADAREALGRILKFLLQAPDESMSVVGVTGTNGKTTTARLLGHVLNQTLGASASLGTLGLDLAGTALEAGSYTTPLSPDLYATLDRLRGMGTKALAMEVSSHALELQRVAGIRFAAATTTRITRDHLDFHGDLEHYIAAKRRLFENLHPDAVAVLNGDCPVARGFSEISPGRLVSYSSIAGSKADLQALGITVSPTKTQFQLAVDNEVWPVQSQLIGRFQVENILAALGVVYGLGLPMEAALEAVRGFPVVSGRMESIALPQGATAVVDYAHNPDGLFNLLENARALNPRRILLVFGCGGDRDRGKRPLMGEIAFRGADKIWLTSDNPRTEDPRMIIEDVLQGIPRLDHTIVEPLRENAIAAAFADSKAGDLLVVAGKGHEDYQIIGKTRYPFSDQGVLRKLIAG